MKNLLFLIASFILVGNLSCQSSQKDQTPDAVKATFKAKYPDENDPDWHRDKNGNFEASFKKDGESFKADFSPEGNWIETENRIKEKDLPDAIKKQLKEHYKDHDIVEIEKVEHYTKGPFMMLN